MVLIRIPIVLIVEGIMKKILLSSALAVTLLCPVAAESFSGVFLGGKGSLAFLNKGSLPDLSKKPLTSSDPKEYGGFGLNGLIGMAELGYSFRFANNFALGLSGGFGYKHYSVAEAADTDTSKEEAKKVGLTFATSTLSTEARLRLGMVFRRFHVYLNPGLELDMANPELTVNYTTEKEDGKKEEKSHKIIYAADKGPDWKERLSFVIGLNGEYALTRTVFAGVGIGFRYSFADVKDMKDNFAEISNADRKTEVEGVMTDIAYKNPIRIEASLIVGASF